MSLQFVFGPSGFGKSTYVQDLVTKEAALHRDREYLMVVPDQFTMQTQMIMAGRNPEGGILNIDVLSFGRLSHRIFSEVGKPDRILLDDLGKCLILRRVINETEKDLKILKKGIHRPGYAEEVKSVLSEFMQYGIRPADLEKRIGELSVSPALRYKLEDFLLLYKAFLKTMEEKYTTKEETLYCLAERIPLSSIIKRSTLVFDGFTGFTPLQYEVLRVLLENARDVMITLPLGVEEFASFPGDKEANSELFYLTKKTVRDLTKIAKESEVTVKEAVFSGINTPAGDAPNRFTAAPSIAYLERNLFRPSEAPYPFGSEEIRIHKAKDETSEVKILCSRIYDLIREKKYRYRDMAVVCGNMEEYADVLKDCMKQYDIPCFIDSTTELNKNPFVCYLRSVMMVLIRNYEYRDVCGFLKSGFSGFDREETDELDNYLLAKKLRGRTAWGRDFTTLTRGQRRSLSGLSKEEAAIRKDEILEGLNITRNRFVDAFAPFETLRGQKQVTVKEWLTAFCQFLTDSGAAEKLADYSVSMEEEGRLEKAQEYSQIYRIVMQLFDQVVSLIGDGVLPLEELSEILDTGYSEIRVGIIPKSGDVLPVCDLVRSRFGDIKALFFIGMNDGNIPSVGSGGGLLSEMEREALLNAGLELAPGRVQDTFTEQLYLYQILTKPSEELGITYLSVTETGESRKPSYLVEELKKLYPKLEITDHTGENLILSEEDLKAEFGIALGNYAQGALTDKEEINRMEQLYAKLLAKDNTKEWAEKLVDSAFDSYEPKPLEKALARLIYGEVLKCSVSSLEKYANCAYAHYLTYGLCLNERETADVNFLDMGNITHAALELFGKYVEEQGEDFASVSDEKAFAIIDGITENLFASFEEGLFTQMEDSVYLTGIVKRVLKRCIGQLKNQLSKGKFRPVAYEQQFNRLLNKEALLHGKIDRVDTGTGTDATYVKIMDYKSGDKDFEELLFRAGAQLQTAVYLSEAIKKFETDHPGETFKPAAMLYYRMQDPLIETVSEDEAAVEKLRNVSLRPTGIFVDDPQVLSLLESQPEQGASEVLPLSVNKDGSISKKGKASKTPEEMEEILQFADEKVLELSKEILSGRIELNPIICDKLDACKYCSFKTACGFDVRLPGYKKRVPEGCNSKEEDDEE